jgi:4-alpha-glucanotransferase
MRVLQFAFDGNPANPHLPRNFTEPCVVYTGTHDNMTARGWYATRTAAQKKIIREAIGYDRKKHKSIARALIETAFNSPAEIAVVPVQDLLNKGNGARMNKPSKAQGNWRWCLTPEEFSKLINGQ